MKVIKVSVPHRDGLSKPVRIELVPDKQHLEASVFTAAGIRGTVHATPAGRLPLRAPRGFLPGLEKKSPGEPGRI